MYCKQGSIKNLLLDHIEEVFESIGKKYRDGLDWIIADDFNDIKHQKILDSSAALKEVVTKPTRYNPPSIHYTGQNYEITLFIL